MRRSNAASSGSQLRTTEIILYGQGILWAGYLALLGLRGGDVWNDDEFIYGLCVFLGIFTIWALGSWKLISGHYCDLYSLLLVSLVTFSGGHAILEIFGLNPHGILDGQHPLSILKDCLTLVVTCLMAFHTGALVRAITLRKWHVAEEEMTCETTKALRDVGTVMIVFSFPPACYVLYQILSVVADSGYTGLYLQSDVATGIDAWYMILASFLLPGALLLLAGSRGHRIGVLLSWILITIPALVNLMAGYRNVAFQAVAALLWLHSAAIKPIKGAFIMLGVVIALLSVPLIASIRNDPLSSSAEKLEALQKAYEKVDKPIVAAVHEMGNVLGTVVYTAELVPEIRPYDWGVGYLYALSTVIPNLFWDLHPADQRGLPSDWLTKEVSPEMVRAGYGLGYSMIAEAYLNFSWSGAPVMMALIGFAVASFVLWVLRRPDPLLLGIEAILITFTLFFPRAESMLFVRPLVWQCVIPYLMVSYLRRRLPHNGTVYAPAPAYTKTA